MLDYFSRMTYFLSFLAKDLFYVQWVFPGPVQYYFSRNHISELFGSGFFLDQCQVIFSRKHISDLFGSGFFLDQC